MKSMLYVGATLMIGASIYGFVDYKQTSQKKEFSNMYEHKDVKDPLVKDEKNVTVVEPVAEKKEVVAKVKKANTSGKKNVVAVNTVDEVIPAIKPLSEENRIAEKELKTIEKTTVDVKTSNKVVVKKKKKKLNTKIFSRAPLREEEEIVLELDKDVKKTENKEQ